MRALVTYSSQSGNTRMLAQEVFESLNCEKVTPEGPSVDPIASLAIRR
jgi:flavodoxin